MSAKTSAEVIIGGKVYTLSGYEGQEYLQKVAAYINDKINEFDRLDEYRNVPSAMKSTLLQLTFADDYYKEKAQEAQLQHVLDMKDRENYDLKPDLLSNQIKTDSANEELKKLQNENKELLINKARLEAALEDSLLGTKKAEV